MPSRNSELRRAAARIKAAYQRETGARHAHGAMRWFAAQAGITPRHLSRVLRAQSPWQPRYERLLERMERVRSR